jgi:hypothetical protein
MTNPLIKAALGGAAITAVVVMMPASGTHAQVLCSSNGWSWHCNDWGPAPTPAWGYYQPGYNHNFYGDYSEIPNDYSGSGPVYNNRY